jgi:hypothetical protein
MTRFTAIFLRALTPARGQRQAGVSVRSGASRSGQKSRLKRGLKDVLPMPRRSATSPIPGGVMLFMHPPVKVGRGSLRFVTDPCQENPLPTIPEQCSARGWTGLIWLSSGSVRAGISGRSSPPFICSHVWRVLSWHCATSASHAALTRAWRGMRIQTDGTGGEVRGFTWLFIQQGHKPVPGWSGGR